MKLKDLRADLREPRTPTRLCQAMSHTADPPHKAEVVVTGEGGGLQWFSCKTHVPKSATHTDDIHKWFIDAGLTLRLGEPDTFGKRYLRDSATATKGQ